MSVIERKNKAIVEEHKTTNPTIFDLILAPLHEAKEEEPERRETRIWEHDLDKQRKKRNNG